ncbi:glutamate racemase [Idiomarina loihiensis]|uniref:glutamate racemase n=1 Tax=Idiomarina TaxID=135575 RepID=UPI000C0EE0A3|nr:MULTISPECIES: glutamate racemase [Idiomarina]MBL4855417.1 glutamate racemase [Idiomarina sp.]MRJ45119.1 glutamate racemase [Idiomarina loihiensis]PHQ89815.1 MAG: glutamate racemase [Idiomarina sp.]TDO50183.1 glutamate racemase [Idiomarina sp. 017G]UTW32095.1 glutamate racemase [Idiomarina loihiensis]
MKVGVFDSGVGGLTVARSLQQSGCFSELLYYGDTARVPYGSKDSNTVTRYALEAVEFFNGADVDCLVVACNTVSVTALEQMQKFSNKPVYGVLEPGVMALEQLQGIDTSARVLVIATRSTINSGAYQQQIQALGYNQVNAMATPLFVPIVEEELYDGPILQETFKHYFGKLEKPDVVLLGCTHFPLIAESISAYFNGAKTIHSGEAMLAWLKQHLDLSAQFDTTPLHIIATENVDAVKRTATRWGLKL